MKVTKSLLKEMIKGELDERCQKGYKTHPKRKTKKMFGRTYRNCIKAEGMQPHGDEYSKMSDAELKREIDRRGMEDLFPQGVYDRREEAEEMLRKSDKEPMTEQKSMFEDATTKSYLRFVGRNPEFREILLSLWDDMTSGTPREEVIQTAEEKIGYKPQKGVFAPMPTVGSEEDYLAGILNGVKFHARKIKSGVNYPSGEEINAEIKRMIQVQKQKRAEEEERRAAARANMPPPEHPIAKYYREKSRGGYTGD